MANDLGYLRTADASQYASQYNNFTNPMDTLNYLKDAGYGQEAMDFAAANNLDISQAGTNTGILGTGISGMDALKGGLGVGQLGLGVLSYLENKKTADKQRGLMDQQAEQNRFLIDQAKQRQKDISGAFGSGGLAASVR